MGRTRVEQDTITNAIVYKIEEEQTKKIKAKLSEARKIYKKQAAPLIKQINAKSKEMSKLRDKLTKLGLQIYSHQISSDNIERIARHLAKIKSPDRRKVFQEVVLAGDSGSNALIKNIVKMFV